MSEDPDHPASVEVCTQVTVLTEMGLHVRPCNSILQVVRQHESELYLQKLDARGQPTGQEARARSAASLLLLEAPRGTELRLRAVGPDAELLIGKVVALFAQRFAME
jgi:phosphotransferase system HPr (HPr) family protein